MMKRISLILLSLLFPVLMYAQSYDAWWKEIDRLISIKNYSQTQPILQKIKEKARSESNSPEWIRAVIAEHHAIGINKPTHQSFYEVEKHLNAHIKQANEIESLVLKNIYAMFLSDKIHLSRVEDGNGFLTWTPQQRHVYIDSIFRITVREDSPLKYQTIGKWETMLGSNKNMILSPMLFHIASYNYLDFLYNKNDSISQRQIKHINSILQQFNKEKEFVEAQAYLAFRSYLGRGSWNIRDHQKEIDSILNNQPANYNVKIAMVMAEALRSSYYYQNRGNKQAVEYLLNVLSKYPYSPWLGEAKAMYKELSKQVINLEMPEFSPVGQYIPITLKTLNTESIYIRVYRATKKRENLNQIKVHYDSLTHLVTTNAPLVHEELVHLHHFGDYETHSTNYKIDPLPAGHYYLLVSNNPSFKDDGQDMDVAKTTFTISDIFISSTIDKEHEKGETYRTVLVNRKTGLPYGRKNIELYEGNHGLTKVASLKTNVHGEFEYVSNFEKEKNDLENLLIYIPNEDQLIDISDIKRFPEHIGYEAKYDKDDQEQIQGLILTDRAIYRPGQEVFFKSILYSNDVLKGKIIANHSVMAILKDVNHQGIDTLRLTTNGFGSVNGSFQIPNRTLNGRFFIEVLDEKHDRLIQKDFSVEEYKRPTFEVVLDENKDTYSKKDTAIFSGAVKTLSGASLSGISVSYKVSFYHNKKRETVYVDTTTMTNLDGQFSFSIPLTDSLFDEQNSFTLQIEIKAINETGEIQETRGAYHYTDRPLRIEIVGTDSSLEGDWKQIVIKSSNTNGHPLPAKGIVHVYKYDEPNIIQSKKPTFDFRKEYHILDTAEYEKYFPWYFDKHVLYDAKPKRLINSYTFDSQDTDTIHIDPSQYSFGKYFIEAYSIQGVDTVRTESQKTVISKTDFKTSTKDFLVAGWEKGSYSIGEKAVLHLQTDFEHGGGVFLWKSTGSTKTNVEFIPFKNGRCTYTYHISGQDIQNSPQFHIMMVQENKINSLRIGIPVIKNNKSIDIQVKTFRDKITPGSKETWSFTLKNNEKQIHSEVLATMYDSSLDQFRQHVFPNQLDMNHRGRWSQIYSSWYLDHFHNFTSSNDTYYRRQLTEYSHPAGSPYWRSYGLFRNHNVLFSSMSKQTFTGSVSVIEEVSVSDFMVRGAALYDELNDPNLRREVEELKSKSADGQLLPNDIKNVLNQVQARTNLQETAFFYPNLLTDKNGDITFEFDSPEALTRWKLVLFAHTKDLKAGTASFFTQTQKQLMVRPNLPRFFREGDEIVIKTHIQNLSDAIQKGTAQLEVINPENNEVVSSAFFADNGLRDFSTAAKGNSVVSWTLRIPKDYATVQVKIVGATDEFSDGEIHELAVLPNRHLITDSKKIILEPEQTQDFVVHSGGKDNLQTKIQVQSNPILEIISALDYLKNYPYACNEQTASKWYGLKMLQYIQKHYPAVSTFFNTINPDETISKLEENTGLSEMLHEEMPWVKQILNDKEKVKSLARLFKGDFTADIQSLEQKLQKAQLQNGSFSWFDGGKADKYISIRILEVFGKVKKLDRSLLSNNMMEMNRKLVNYLDQDTVLYATTLRTSLVWSYLYARTLWNDIHPLDPAKAKQLTPFFEITSIATAKQSAGMAARAWLINSTYDFAKVRDEIQNRITDEVIYDKERGMYWESNGSVYNAVSLHSYLVEMYQQYDPTKVNEVTQWIYYSKQHNNWRTTWNTVDAVYALLLANNPKDFALENTVTVRMDGEEVETNDKVLGQVSRTLSPQELKTDKTISVSNHNNRKIYGGIYHQYFVPLEEVQSVKNELSVEKKMFVEKNGEWVESTTFKTGEKIKVQLIVVNNEDLNYVHLKDSRAAGFEPIYQPSGYTWWQGYYFTIKDASTNYFFDYLPKGRHVYEYEVKTNNNGVFNSGIAQIECMYDPTTNARSANLKVEIRD